MPNASGNHHHHAGPQGKRLSGYGKFIRARENIHHLLVRVIVLVNRRTRLDPPVHDSHILRVDKACVMTRDHFARRDFIEMNQLHDALLASGVFCPSITV
jgi:hypothetical protein